MSVGVEVVIRSVELYDQVKTTTTSLSIKCKLSSRSPKQKRKNRKPITKLGNEHCDWFILPLLLPTPTMWFSLDRKQRCHKRSPNWRKWKRSGYSDSDSDALITPLASPTFYFHWVISALYDPAYDSNSVTGADVGGGCRGCAPPPPEITLYGRFTANTKFAVSFDMYSQQLTLCYCLVKSLLLHIRF